MSAVSLAQDSALQSYEVELIVFRVNHPAASPENWAALSGSALKGSDSRSSSPNEEGSATTATATTVSVPAVDTATTASFPAMNVAQFRMNSVEESLRKTKAYQPLAHFGWTQPGFPPGNSPKFSIQSYLPGFLPEGIAVSGEVSLSRGPRLLHLMLDLTYQAPDGQRYVLRETRRMRSTEKHYLDHPYFGVIALVTPKG